MGLFRAIGRGFKVVENWWGTLTSLRRFILETTVVFALTGIGNYASARFGLISWPPLATGMNYLREYFLNGYVASALASALVVGFWQYLVKGFQATAPLLRALWPLGALLAAFFIIPNIIDWWQSRNDPALFQLRPFVVKNAATLKMGILNIQPSDIAAIYRNNTSIAADRLIKPYVGQFMPITGVIYDVSLPDNNGTIQVKLDGSKTMAALNFDDEPKGPILALKKHQRIKALCRFLVADQTSVGLDACGLIP